MSLVLVMFLVSLCFPLISVCLFFPTVTFILNNMVCYVLCLVAQSCPTFCDPMDCSVLGSSVMRILQARILEPVAVPSSRESSQPRD